MLVEGETTEGVNAEVPERCAEVLDQTGGYRHGRKGWIGQLSGEARGKVTGLWEMQANKESAIT